MNLNLMVKLFTLPLILIHLPTNPVWSKKMKQHQNPKALMLCDEFPKKFYNPL